MNIKARIELMAARTFVLLVLVLARILLRRHWTRLQVRYVRGGPRGYPWAVYLIRDADGRNRCGNRYGEWTGQHATAANALRDALRRWGWF